MVCRNLRQGGTRQFDRLNQHRRRNSPSSAGGPPNARHRSNGALAFGLLRNLPPVMVARAPEVFFYSRIEYFDYDAVSRVLNIRQHPLHRFVQKLEQRLTNADYVV